VDHGRALRWAWALRQRKRWAKLANKWAERKYPDAGSVVDLMDPDRQNACWRWSMWSDVWGVGRRTTEKFTIEGHHTALELCNADPKNPFEVSFLW